MTASALHELEPAAEWRAGRRRRSGGVDPAPRARPTTPSSTRRWPRPRGRAPTRWSSSGTTSRSTAWRPSSTASSTSSSTAAASPASPRSTPTRYGDDDLTLLYWGIGLHLGEPWAQNKYGHVLGDVTDQGKTIDDPTVRGNELGGIALDYHTDGSDLVGLLCLRTARTGGLSCVANAVAIHNQLVRESPRPGRRALRAAALRHPGRAGRGRAGLLLRCRRSPSTPGGSSSASSPSTSSPRNATPTRPGSARRPARPSPPSPRWPTTRTSTSTWTCSRARCSSSTTTTCSTAAPPTRTTSRTATSGTSSGCGWPPTR